MESVILRKLRDPMATVPPGDVLRPRIFSAEWDFLDGITKRLDDTSQFGETTLLLAIFEKIGMKQTWCFECGGGEPEHNNTTKLFRDQQWQTVLIEKDPHAAKLLRSRAGPWAIVVEQEATDLDAILADVRCPWCRSRFPYHADFGVIDVDGQDWHLWKRMVVYNPRIMVVECWPYDDAAPVPERGGKGQAGEHAIVQLGRDKFYEPICRTTCNVIFQRQKMRR